MAMNEAQQLKLAETELRAITDMYNRCVSRLWRHRGASQRTCPHARMGVCRGCDVLVYGHVRGKFSRAFVVWVQTHSRVSPYGTALVRSRMHWAVCAAVNGAVRWLRNAARLT